MNYYDYSLYEHVFLGSLKETLCLSLMKYHGVSIKNIYSYQFSSRVTKSIRNI